MSDASPAAPIVNLGKDALGDVFGVIADYVAPILGLVVGWVMGTAVGGVLTICNFINDIINPTNASKYYPIVDISGGVIMAAIWAALGGAFWSASGRFKTGKIMSRVAGALLRFLGGMGFGMAIQAIVSGFTGNAGGIKSGFIDQMSEDLTSSTSSWLAGAGLN